LWGKVNFLFVHDLPATRTTDYLYAMGKSKIRGKSSR
jgi:hypothetical protein